MYKLFGTFDPVTGARIETALTAAANRLWHGTDDKSRPTPKQRLADALESLITGGTGKGISGTGKGISGTGNGNSAPQGVDLLVIADYDIVAGRLRDAHLGDGTPLSPEELLRLACDAKILPALFDRKGQPLWLGQRPPPRHLRPALGAHRARQGMHRLRRLSQLVPGPPHRSLGTWRTHGHRQSLPAVQPLPSPPGPHQRRQDHPRPRRQVHPPEPRRTPTGSAASRS